MMSLFQRARSRLATVAASLAAPLLVAAGCSSIAGTSNPTDVHRETATVLALGDSILEWHLAEGGSIPQVIGEVLDRPVHNVAVGGAFFADPPDGETDIRDQYEAVARTDYEWVVMNGGANDLNRGCGCADCDETLDGLLSADGSTGSMVDFVRRLTDDGARVILIGYYEIRDDADFNYADCIDILTEHDRRLALLADSIDGVVHVPTTDVVTADNRSAYAEDRFHPSAMGSRLIGERVAAAMLAAEG